MVRSHSLNFTLETSVGPLDPLGEVTGGGSYGDLLAHTIEVEVFGIWCRCLDLPALIRTKRAAGRPKDLEAIAELEVIWQVSIGRHAALSTVRYQQDATIAKVSL